MAWRSAAWLFAVGAGCGFSTGTPATSATDGGDHARDGAAPSDAAAHDAAPMQRDAVAFDPSACPATYTTIGGAGSSLYFVPSAADETGNYDVAWQTAEAACEADTLSPAGATHLVVFDTADERTAVVAAAITPEHYNWIWTGMYITDSTAAWTKITGGAPTDTGNWAPTQPTYDAANGSDMPNGALIESPQITGAGQYYSQPFVWAENYVCECDGLAATMP